MIDVRSGEAMAQHVAALIEMQATASSADSLTRIENKLNTALTGAVFNANTNNPNISVLPTTQTLQRLATLNRRRQKQGMCRETGRLLSGVNHLKQSIADIVCTLIGRRVMRRQYGSRLFERIDQPQNSLTRLGMIADIAEALDKWEPRFSLRRVKLAASTQQQSNGQLFCNIIGDYLGSEVSLEFAL